MNGMNGINGHAGLAAPALWQEARNADGRVYYYNTITKATQWTKPEDLMSPAERALANQPWKEYTAEGGRKYWYNTESKQSSWEMPDAYKEALAKDTPVAAPVAPAAPTFVAGGGFASSQYDRDSEPLGEARQIAYGNDVNGSRAQNFVPANTDPNYQTFEEGESAFLKLLRRNNVDPNWTWDQTLRAIIKDPQYRSLKDPRHRKAAFEKYAVEVRLQEKDRAKDRLEKLRKDFAIMLKSHPEIEHYTRWKTARPIIEGETIFRSASDDEERRQLFEDYIIELKKANIAQEKSMRRSALDELVDILQGLNLDTYTRWSVAQSVLQSNQRFQDDQKFRSLSKSDLLTAFEDHVKVLEKTYNDVHQLKKNQKARKERQNRDRYASFLQELKASKKIRAGSKWTQLHPLISADPRYQAMLGQSGSTPMEMFWDVVEEEERSLRTTRNDVLDVLEDKRHEIHQKTTFEEFYAWMQNDRRTANVDRDDMLLIFERLHKKVSQRSEDDKHQAERKQRRQIDDLRSVLKRLEPSVRVDDTYEKVRPRIEKSAEYLAISTEEVRRSAFDKFIRRLKEREEDIERDRLKRRERDSVDRSSHRDRDRGERGERAHRTSGRHARTSRSPEPDAYEADRRKAIADREKNYRKSSVADTLLSPSRRVDRADRERERERDRDHREMSSRDHMDLDKPSRSRREDSMSHYDRERRDRENEREKMYRRRGDPRGSIDELPYGDERPTIRRRRADSDAESAGSGRLAKKSRTEAAAPRERSPVPSRRRKTTPLPAVLPPKEDPAVHSGSEEGEIEEE